MQDKYKEVLIVLITGMTVLLILTGVIIFILLFYQKKRFQHRQQFSDLRNSVQQELLKTQLETQEETFLQIGNEIHDNVGQLLSSTKILLAISERSLPEVPDTLRTASETLAKAIQELRSLSKTLNREWLERFNIIENLSLETERINSARMIRTSLSTIGPAIPLPPESQVMLFRVVQEALQNCIKHAEASAIAIQVLVKEENIRVMVSDNGNGNPPGAAVSGIGITSMKHRVHLMEGTITWDSVPGSGTAVTINIPAKTVII